MYRTCTMPRLLLLLSFLGLLLHSCSGASYTFYVDATNGVDSQDCLNVTANVPCKTIGYALAPAGVSDNIQIFILPGTYKGVGNVNLNPNAGGHVWTGYGSSRPVIDCEYQNNALTLSVTRPLNPFHTFENVEFKNCVSATGGAINILRAPTVTFTNCTFSNNHATQTGGAIQASAGPARLTINSCTFRNNSAGPKGGAISAQSTSATQNIVLTLSNSIFDSNQAEAGGAIYGNELGNTAVTTVFSNCAFTKNVASSSNGGAFFGESTALRTYSFAGSTIDNNCGNTIYTDSSDVQIRCASSEATCSFADKGTITGCTDTYVPPTNSSDDDGGGSNKNRAIIIGVVVPISIIAIVAIALFLYFRKGHKKEMEKRDEYRKRILKALDNMPAEEQEAARIEAQNADPKAPKCQLCKERPIVTPLPCGHQIVCAICRTILLECPVKNCKHPTR